MIESYGVLSKSWTQFKGNAHSNSNQLNFGVPIRSQAIFFQFCTRFLGKIVGHFFLDFCFHEFSDKVFDELQNQNKH